MLRRLATGTALVGLILTGVWFPSAAAGAAIPADTRCRNGSVQLTFDDGPHAKHTPRLLRSLRTLKAPATFFVTGSNARRHPHLLRQMARDGHAVENHSWDHPRLTRLSSKAVRSQLSRTSSAIRSATGRSPRHFRPPYGLTNARVKKVAKDLGMKQRLWTIDTKDWEKRSAARIRSTVLGGLRKNRDNTVLLHDGVGNSARTVDAVPGIVKGARKAGFCLRSLNPPPPPKVRGEDKTVGETTRTSRVITVRLRLDAPTTKAASVRVRTHNATAKRGVHYDHVLTRVHFPKGASSAAVKVRIRSDRAPTPPRAFDVVLSKPKGLRIGAPRSRVTITDSDGWGRTPPPAASKPTPTPRPTPTPTPAPAPAATPTPTPTRAPTPTPAPTATPTPTPDPDPPPDP